ncbi:MAG TPA: CGNR zinc finger domain-containing protein [Solirubrobacterales bacterium]|nr:CGNR zinc finger domain-containing protein [Solirubrobacterales bacterium]
MSTSLNKALIDSEADLLVEFVNSRDIEEETDSIADSRALGAWIEGRTGEPAGELDDEDVGRVQALRESLRALLLANNGEEADVASLIPLREAAERTRIRTTFSADGRLDLAPARSGLSGFEARLLLAIERLQSLGAWPRLKACTDEGCQWAFYDATRNHSRTWCSMDVCGNREKTRRYRARRDTGS